MLTPKNTRPTFSHKGIGSGGSSVVRVPDLKGPGFESLLETRENFLLNFRCRLRLISVSVPPPCYRSST